VVQKTFRIVFVTDTYRPADRRLFASRDANSRIDWIACDRQTARRIDFHRLV